MGVEPTVVDDDDDDGQLSLFSPLGYVNQVPTCLARLKVGRIHLYRPCWVASNTV